MEGQVNSYKELATSIGNMADEAQKYLEMSSFIKLGPSSR
jgi:hypothetical protein